MKLKNCILAALCAMAALSQTSRAALQAALPEFKSKQALQAQAASRQITKEKASENVFYTGKPFEAEREGYLFKYRSYSVELSRWSSVDPSGFPDGANNQAYSPSPLTELDSTGLRKSLGQPPLPDSIDWIIGSIVLDDNYPNNDQGAQYRWKLTYTDWITTAAGGVSNVGAAYTFTGSVSISETTSFGANYGFSPGYGITFGGSYESATGSSLSAESSESMPATPKVSWEAKLLIAHADFVVESRRMIKIDGAWLPYGGEDGRWQENGMSHPGIYMPKPAIEWFE